MLKLTLTLILCIYSQLALAQMTLRTELARPIAAAQALIGEQKMQDALVKLDEARAVSSLNEDEKVLIERLSAVAALGAKQNDRSEQSLKYLLGSEKVSSADKDKLIESLIGLYQSTKSNDKLISAAQQYFKQGGGNSRVRLPLAQALAIDKQYAAALEELRKKQEADKGAKPAEAELRVGIFVHSRLKNDVALLEVLKTTVSLYPKTDYWIDLIGVLLRKPGLSKRQEMDIYSLMEEVGALVDEEDYLEMMDVALKVGLPKQVLRLAGKAQKANVITQANLSKLEAYKSAATKSAKDDDTFKQSQARSGNELAQLADVYFSEDNFDKAAALYESATKAGSLKYESEVILHQGVALYKNRQFAAAKAVFDKISNDQHAQLIASIWTVLIK